MDRVASYGTFTLEHRTIEVLGSETGSNIWLRRISGPMPLDLGTIKNIGSKDQVMRLIARIEWSQNLRDECKEKALEIYHKRRQERPE